MAVGGTTIADLFGLVDNSQETPAIFNYPAVAYTFVLIFLTIAIASALARLYVRLLVVRYPGMDDLFVVLALVTGTGLGISVMVSYSAHMGQHFITFALDTEEVKRFTMVGYLINAMYPTATGIVKIAILLQFLRLFERGGTGTGNGSSRSSSSSSPNSKIQKAPQLMIKQRRQTIAMLAITGLWTAGFCFIGWFPAFPIAGMWDRSIPAVRYGLASDNVGEFTGTYIAQTATNMVLDLLILCIPIPYFLKSSASKKSRMSLMGLFTVGSIINVLSLIRLVTVVDNKVGTYPTFDPSFYTATATVLSSLEVSLAITAASLPVFWPILTQNLSAIFVTTEVRVTREEAGGGGGGSGGDGGPGAGYAMSGWTAERRQQQQQQHQQKPQQSMMAAARNGPSPLARPLPVRHTEKELEQGFYDEPVAEYADSWKDEKEDIMVGMVQGFKRPMFSRADAQKRPTSLYAETV